MIQLKTSKYITDQTLTCPICRARGVSKDFLKLAISDHSPALPSPLHSPHSAPFPHISVLRGKIAVHKVHCVNAVHLYAGSSTHKASREGRGRTETASVVHAEEISGHKLALRTNWRCGSVDRSAGQMPATVPSL